MTHIVMINGSNTIQQRAFHANTPTRPHGIAANDDNPDFDNKTETISKTDPIKNDEQEKKTRQSKETEAKNKTESELSESEIKELRELRSRDREVRAHEQAHTAAAGSLAKGGARYDYERGPDGQLYAVGGEVQIDTSPVPGDPEATAAKAEKVRRAALAPANPSQQDQSVAAAAATLEAQARIEIAKQRMEDTTTDLNSRLSDETNSDNNEISENTNVDNDIEANSKCSQCGGQHSAESHSVSVMLDKTFHQTDMDAFAYAIKNNEV